MSQIDEVRCDLCNKVVSRTEHELWGGKKSAYGFQLHASGDIRMSSDLCRGCYNKTVAAMKKLGMKLKVKDGKTNL